MSNISHRRIRKYHTMAEEDYKNECTFSSEADNNFHEGSVLFGLVIFRLCNVALVQTWFVPDEYWQGTEVAHGMVYGYGFQTWEWKEGIRGYTYPLIIAILYKCIQALRMDWPGLVIYMPRIFQALCGAVGEFYVYKFAKLTWSPRTAWWMLLCEVTSWFMFYCITRTLTNSVETALISTALYFWQFSHHGNNQPELIKSTSLYKALILASCSCLVRPTALIVWLPLGVARLWKSKTCFNIFFKYIFPVGIATMIFSFVLDSWCYQKFTLVQYNFVYFNIMKNIGEIYGTHPWYWYLTQGIPVVLASHLVPFCIGVYYSDKALRYWFLLVIINVSVYSVLSHKEFRFIMPIVPVAMCICGKGLHQIADHRDGSVKKDDNNMRDYKDLCTLKGKLMVMFLIITNVPAALYTGIVHQRGTIDVMATLREQLHHKNDTNFSILFLMPCHSTPFYSHIHRKIDMRFLDCSPSKQPEYIDEADKFYKQPRKWLKDNYEAEKKMPQLPSHIVFFDVLLKDIKEFLSEHFYVECGRFFYSHFPSGRLGKSVLLHCKQTKNTLQH